MDENRKNLYSQLESLRDSKLVVYVTSTRQNMETQIAGEVLPKFGEHLDKIGDTKRISLYLYTNGGITSTAWSLVNLLRSYCDELEMIIPSNCFSAGTLICLGANRIVMTKQAVLGPIDPSVNGPLNPSYQTAPNQKSTFPVSVEHVNAYIEMAKKDFGITDESNMTNILLNLSEKIHPLTLGQVYKIKAQIQMMARNLLKWQNLDKDKEYAIINFLCSESGSHDYSIRRKEAAENLGLPIEIPSEETDKIIREIFKSISEEMELENPFKPEILLNNATDDISYSCRRVLVESLHNGTDVYLTKGKLTKQGKNYKTFEYWQHENL